MKRKLLLAALFVVSALGFNAKAQEGGTYYIQNVGAGRFIEGGNDWGTKATITDRGIEFTLAVGEGTYTIKSGLDKGFLGIDGFVDQASANWTITPVGDGAYTLAVNGKYLVWSGEGTALDLTEQAPTSANGYYKFITKEERIAALANATKDNPISATFLIGDPNFSRHESSSPWTMTANNKNLAGGNQDNFCAESYHSTFSLTQTINAPKGVYSLTAQGFYRQDGSDNDNLPYFFIGDEKMTFPVKTGSENSMNNASTSFSNGLYITSPIYVAVGDEGTVELGAKNDVNTSLWCIWDNFQIMYYGNVSLAEVVLAEYVKAYNEAMDAAEAYQSVDMFDEDKATLNAAIANNTLDLTATTEEGLTAATENLNKATAEAELAAAKYATYTTANSLINGGTNVDITEVAGNLGFETGDLTSWTSNNGGWVANNNNFNGKIGTYFVENWQNNVALGSGSLTHDVICLPKGYYTISANAHNIEQYNGNIGGTGYYLCANDEKVEIGESKTYSVIINLSEEVNNLTIKFLLDNCTGNWVSCDDIRIVFNSEDLPPYTLVEGKMNADVAAAQTAAAEKFEADRTLDNYNALLAAINDAQASKTAYENAKVAIDNMYDLMNSTNVYTKEAYDTFKAAADAYFGKWDAGTLTETVVNPYAVQDWGAAHANPNPNMHDDFLLSAWGTKDFDTNLYINTWSVEGEGDGSNFKVPFFEYWTGDDQSLGATTKTATVAGLEAGKKYVASAWVRVRMKNGAVAPTYGITLSVGADGAPVDVAAGVNIPNSPFYIGEYKAVGVADAEGNLTINFNIAADNNISWLSYKNVNYSEYHTTSNLDFSESTPIDNHICTYAKDMATNGTTYSQMQPVTSWDMAVENGDARAAGVFAYGGTPWIGGAGYPAPATNPEGVAEGNALGMVGVWSATVQYTQPVTLLPGNYVLTVPVYNTGAGKNNMAKNLIGFIAEDGTEYLASAKVYPSNTWTTETITFTLDKVTNGVLSLGYQAPNAGNGSQHHLFIDCVKIKVVTDLDLAKEELLADIKDAKATVDAKAGVGEGLFLIPTSALETYAAAVEAAQTAHDAATTVADVEAAIATLAAATEAYAASIALPEADKDYQIIHNASGLFMSLNGGVKIEAAATVKFEAAGDGKYYIANANGEYAYYSGTGDNKWSLNVSAGSKEAWTITAVGDGLYTIKGKNGHIGTDNLTNGSTCYGNKAGNIANSMWLIKEATEVSVTMNISDAKYSTFIAPFGVTIPEGVTASKVTGETNGVLTLETVETTIPANTPVVLYSETAYNSKFTGIDLSTKDSYTDGLLTGIYTATDVQLGWYVLQNNSGKVGFYRVDAEAITKVGANRCYLTIPAGSKAKAFFFGGEATGISAIEALQNGDAEIYTINGTRVNTLQKGVNIIKMSNGKTQKVLVK